MTWVKGQSGNPTGRPKEIREIAELARSHAPAILERLAQIALTSKNEAAAARAGELVLERGLGKAIQPIDHGASLDTLDSRVLEALQSALHDVARAAGGSPTVN